MRLAEAQMAFSSDSLQASDTGRELGIADSGPGSPPWSAFIPCLYGAEMDEATNELESQDLSMTSSRTLC